jgi:hypothetical protein
VQPSQLELPELACSQLELQVLQPLLHHLLQGLLLLAD